MKIIIIIALLLVSCKSIAPKVSRPEGLAVSKSFLWPDAEAEVCFKNKGYAKEKRMIKEAVEREFNGKTSFTFTGFKDCQGKVANRVELEFVEGVAPHVTPGYPNGASATYKMFTLKFVNDNFSVCRSCKTEDKCLQKVCMNNVTLHEFGHIVGLMHEQDRPDSTCDKHRGKPHDDARYIGTYDSDSVMNACNHSYSVELMSLSEGDIATINKLYGSPQIAESFQDQDSDTVHDKDDLCQDTPEGEAIWLLGSCRGCSAQQIADKDNSDDQDLDGVPDLNDRCPDTPKCAQVWQQGQYTGCTGGDTVK